MNLFKISPNDISMDYLSRVFGSVSGVITTKAHAVGAINILSTMFKVFNGVILTVAVLMLVYVTVVGVIGTAHEGEFMGKKWNNIWIPIRAVLGFALLVPTGAGYCGIQIIMMWVIVQGIGAADVLWNTALSYINIVGTYPQIQVTPINATTTLSSLFQGLVCHASVNFNGTNPFDPNNRDVPGGYYCTAQPGRSCSNTTVNLPNEGRTLKLGPGNNGDCGTLTFCDQKAMCSNKPNSLECMSCNNQITALKTIVPTLSIIAGEMVKADYDYKDFYANAWKEDSKGNWSWIYQYCASKNISKDNCCIINDAEAAVQQSKGGFAKICAGKGIIPFPDQRNGTIIIPENANTGAVVNVYWPYWPQFEPSLGKTSFINSAFSYYSDQAQAAVTNYIAQQGQNASNLSGITKDAAADGWALAGAYYYRLANETGKDFKKALASFEWTTPQMNNEVISKYRNNYNSANALIVASNEAASKAGGGSGTRAGNKVKVEPIHLFSKLSFIPGLGSIDNDLTNGFQNVASNFEASSVGGGSNPLLWISALGQTLLVVASAIFFTILIVVGIVGIAGNISIFIWGNTITNPIGPTLETIGFFLVPFVYGLLAILVSAGGMLGVYVPMIPFVVFAFGVIGWLISVVEAMVAGPLVGLGVISPSGQHELLGKAEPALMLLFNIFLRPSLMIFGLIAAMLLATVVAAMINKGMWGIIYASRGGVAAYDPLGFTIFIIVYVMITIAALNKCFAVINLLPQQVMRWIGGQGEGVEAPLAELKGGVEAGAGGVKGAAGGVEEGRGGVARAYAESKRGGGGGGMTARY